MGRGKVVLERIENKINRRVTFSKRSNGLLKKAYEISLLCDCEVALIIFSSHGKLYEFGSAGLSRTIQRYNHYCYSLEDNNVNEHQSQSLYQEVTKLRAKYEFLQCSERHLLGEDIEPLNVKELQNLEKQLDGALTKARQRKTEMLLEQMEELRKKEWDLRETHKQLKAKLEKAERRVQATHSLWNAGAPVVNTGLIVHPSQFHATEPRPTSQIGYRLDPPGVEARTVAGQSSNIPQEWWCL